ncbi:MAG TPA: hypothetical protein VGI81_22510 [Tepidisphaeraceae bacterium]
MKRIPTLQHLQGVIRAKVCADCPYRTPGGSPFDTRTPRECEETCPMFVHLPVVRDVAGRTDPMVGHRRRRIEDLLLRLTNGRSPHSKYVRGHARSLAAAIDRLLRY